MTVTAPPDGLTSTDRGPRISAAKNHPCNQRVILLLQACITQPQVSGVSDSESAVGRAARDTGSFRPTTKEPVRRGTAALERPARLDL